MCKEYLQSSVLKVKTGRGATSFATRPDGTLDVAKGREHLVPHSRGVSSLKNRRVLKIRLDK
jgi:hypothetical protein